MKRDCPDEESMACFVEGRLPEGECREIEEHIVECSSCREIVLITEVVWLKEKNGHALKVPKDLLGRVKSLINKKRELLR